MYTVIAGKDHTNDVPFDGIQFSQNINDPQPQAQLDVLDIGSQFSFLIGDEVIIFDENAPRTPVTGGTTVASTPAHNLIPWNGWQASGVDPLITNLGPDTMSASMTNTTNGSEFIFQTLPTGYIHAGMSFMFSATLSITTALSHAQTTLQMDFQDIGGNTLQHQQATITSTPANPVVTVQGAAPAGAFQILLTVTVDPLVSGNNAGAFTWSAFQCEPMWFVSQGVQYPTQYCAFSVPTCFQMPDNTVGRARIFAGSIDSYERTYDGPNRTWHLTLAGPGAALESLLLNATYQGFPDSSIINDALGHFSGTPYFSGSPNSQINEFIETGVTIDSISFSDTSFREVLNQMVNESGFLSFADPYYNLHYHPAGEVVASWRLTDGKNETIDNVNTFAYYDYTYSQDGTQRKRHVKVVGNKGVAPAHTDGYNGGGSGVTVYALTLPPVNIQSITVNGSSIVCGVKGRDTNGVGGIQALLDTGNQTVIFNTGPASGANVQITYTYSAPMVVEVFAQNTENLPTAPAYVLPPYDAKVNDSMLVSLKTTNQRGISELTHFSSPLLIIKLKCHAYTPSGSLVYFTSTLDGLTKQPLLVQSVIGRCLGNGINEFEYQLGNYLPTFIDHIRNSNKTMNRNTTLANTTKTLQTGLMLSETISYFETITIH